MAAGRIEKASVSKNERCLSENECKNGGARGDKKSKNDEQLAFILAMRNLRSCSTSS